MSSKTGQLFVHDRFTVQRRVCRAVEQHRIETKFGPVDVRVYRLKYGWWPVALGGPDQLPADPVIEGHVLPETVEAALQRVSAAIDAITAERPPPDTHAVER